MSGDTMPLLDAASSSASVATNLIEIVRCDWIDHPAEISSHEVIEHLAHAIYQVGSIALTALTGDDAEMLGQLLASANRYLDGWKP